MTTKAQHRDRVVEERAAHMEYLNRVRRAIDEFDTQLIDLADEYEERFLDDDACVETVYKDYLGRWLDIPDALVGLRDELLTWERRIKTAKTRLV